MIRALTATAAAAAQAAVAVVGHLAGFWHVPSQWQPEVVWCRTPSWLRLMEGEGRWRTLQSQVGEERLQGVGCCVASDGASDGARNRASWMPVLNLLEGGS